MSPSPSITRSGQGQPPAGGTQPRSGTRPPSTRSRDMAEWARGGRPGVPAPQRPEAGPRANIKGKMERENLFHGQVREEGLKEPELPEPGQQRSRAPSSPSCQPSPPHLGKVKISRKRLQIGLTPPLPLNKVYYRPGSNPFKSPTRGDGPGLGEGSVIPMNLLQGDLGSAGRADGPGPGSGKQPFSLMIPNKDKRAERIGDRRRGPTPTEVLVPRDAAVCLPAPDHRHGQHRTAAPQLVPTFFQQLPGPHIPPPA